MSKVRPESLSTTVTQMATQTSVTLGWDVIVNYSEPAINELLEKTYKEKPKTAQVTAVDFAVTIWDLDDGEETARYNLKLAAPRISFNARNAKGPSCNLTFPVIGGTVKRDAAEARNIPFGRFSLFLGTLKLATAKGTVKSETLPYNQLFVFPDGDGNQQGSVVIDLPTSRDLEVKILVDQSTGVPLFNLIDRFTNDIAAAIKGLFIDPSGVYRNIQYEIARVTNDVPSPDSSMIQLQPKAFRFDAYLPSEDSGDEDIGILTLFIQTGDKRGKEDELSTTWVGLWRSTLKCTPIPEGSTASIIFSKDMVYESVIAHAIKAHGFSAKKLLDTKGSLSLEIDTGKRIYRDEYEYKQVKDGTEYNKISKIDKTLPNLMLTLYEDSGSPSFKTNWEFEFTFDWQYLRTPQFLPPHYRPRYHNGVITATYTMTKDPRKIQTELDNVSLKMECSISQGDWQSKLSQSDPNRDWWDFMGSTPRDIPQWVKEVPIVLPGFTIHTGGFNFFLTTNLLFPDNTHVIDVDTQAGLRIPADLYVVGKVTTK